MAKIIVLTDIVCNQIAAGEVVERPAAVVKELMENSIDANSHKIFVAILRGGSKEIRVVDNGEGMNPEDALLALERHATSKIRTAEDLQNILSLGFRGEALPSIAAVSRFELITREKDALSGSLVSVEGGVLRDVREAGCPVGTTITVRDLFHNVPARRKFLRSIDTEMAHINEQFLRLSLAHPEIHFQLTHEGRVQYDFPRTTGLAERAAQALGPELSETLHPFSAEAPPLLLHGLVSPPEMQRANSNGLFAFINKRPVQDRQLNRSILAAYDTLLPRGKFPLVILFLEIPPALVDVNSHPTKREVRFNNPGQIFVAVRNAIGQALDAVQGKRWQVRLTRPQESLLPIGAYGLEEHQNRLKATPLEPRQITHSAPSVQPAPFWKPSGTVNPTGELDPTFNEEPLFSRLPVIGQLANAYILLESPEGLVLIDQHAAHERVLFDRLTSSPREKSAQRLLKPEVVELFPREAATIRRWLDRLNAIGFEMESFGGDSFVIHAVPAALSGVSPAILLRELVEGGHEEQESPKSGLEATLAKTAACHSAVRVGQKLQREEILELLQALDRTKASATCPHGRPLWWKLTLKEIARFFNRL
jgi:DNA mismatch repair protein MutL